MPRPRKCRRVCCLPQILEFQPVNGGGEAVTLSVDEFETIRLIDREGLSQEECGQRMDVARTTVQQIYTTARGKLVRALVEGRPQRISGGEYRLCQGMEGRCGCGLCYKRDGAVGKHISKGERPMKVAIPVDDTKGAVCVSFGRAPYFLFRDVETGNDEILVNPAAEAQGGAGIQSAQFVVDNGADTLITVRCGENAAQVFQAAGMKIFKAQSLDTEESLRELQSGKLQPLDHFHAGYHGIR